MQSLSVSTNGAQVGSSNGVCTSHLYVESALHDCPTAIPQINWEGNTADFIHALVTGLNKYGDCGDTPAIARVLREVADKQGDDVKVHAEKLITEMISGDTSENDDEICGCQRIRPLGGGGNGMVWLAWQPGTEREVAIKLLRPEKADKPERVRRFREEPRAQAKLSAVNAHVTQVFQVCEYNELPAIVMQYVAGGSLEAYLSKHGMPSAHVACDWLAQIANALDAAHTLSEPLYHRDVKPENILVRLGDDGQPDHLYLTDFGLALSDDPTKPRETMQGEKVGTREYIAPEQFASDYYHHGISAATDVYALAIMAYELLTGVLPFTGDDDEILAGHRSLPLPEHPSLAPFVLDALREGAAKDPTKRPESATAFVNNLRDALAGKAPAAIEHYLTDTLENHIQRVMPEEVFDALKEAYVRLAGETKKQRTPKKRPPKTKKHLTGKGLGFGIKKKNVTAPPPLELSGELHAPHEQGHYGEPEYTPDIRERVRTLKRVVMLGAPGAGKTFTLARLALDYAKAYYNDPNTPIPIFVPLSTYDTDEDFADFVARRMDGLAYGEMNAVWLLDALNEMPRDKGQLKHVLAFVNGLVKADTPFVLTCRVRDYEEDLRAVPELHRVDLQDLNPQQIHSILMHYIVDTDAVAQIWAGVMYGMDGETNLLEAWDAWDGSVNTFWQRPERTWDDNRTKRAHNYARDHIYTDPRKLMLLCRSPFTLVRLLVPGLVEAVEYADENSEDLTAVLQEVLPNNRAALFGAVIDSMLAAEGERKGWTKDDEDAIKSALEFTASALQATQQRTEMSLPDLLSAEKAPADLHDRLKMGRDAGLVTVTDTAVRFNHQLYQEYFATSRLRGLLADYDARYPDWEQGEPLPPRDERLVELFPQWWNPEGWRVTVALLGELEGVEGTGRVARWLASYTPSIAVEILIEENNDGLTLAQVLAQTPILKQTLIAGATARLDEENPVGRAAAYRVLGPPDIDADNREGIGLREDGLPDIQWGDEIAADTYTIGGDTDVWEPFDEREIKIDAPYALSTYLVTYRP
ncbi:MAG: protein kinase [Chloroflexota bacterium]